MIGRSLRIREK